MERAALDTRILILGTGFSGLGMAIRLKQAGIDDFVILEQAGDVGGTWRDNHYPGAACDVPAHLYSFSFAPNPDWSRKFAPQREILDYLRRCADRFGLRRHLRLRARVVSARFDAAGDAWEVTTEGGATLRASIVVSGCGGLSRPALPDIPGRARFAGAAFHSARWDHDYPLAGKAVAVIGTGASAIQFVPAIAPQVARLSLFQRTPAWVLPRRDHEISATTRRRYARAPLTRWLRRQAIYWRNEGVAIPMTLAPRILELAARLGVAHLRRQIADPRLRAALTPDYTMGCKRVLLSDDYYPALARDNVTLVTAGIERIDETGVITRDGAHHPVDAILYGTGFQAAEDVAPFPIFGRDGQELADVWRAGAEAYYGTAVAGFPNLFLIVGPNTGLGHSSMVLMIESQIAFILRCLERMDRARLTRLEVREDAQRRFNAGIHRRLSRTVWASGCASWYQTSTGKNTTLWPGFTWEFRLRTRRPRFSDFEARPA